MTAIDFDPDHVLGASANISWMDTASGRSDNSARRTPN